MKLALSIIVLLPCASLLADDAVRVLPIQHRRPEAAVLLDGGRRLCVANRRSGTLSLVNLADRTVTEKLIGQQLSDIESIPGSHQLLVSDFAGGMVMVVDYSADQLKILDRIEVAAWPESLAVSQSGELLGVASLWSRRLTVLSRRGSGRVADATWEMRHRIDLPFAPRAMVFADATHLVVADSFGGRLAVVDGVSGAVMSSFELPVHNIRHMTIDPDRRLYLTCQRLNPKGYASSEDIHWGILMENEVLTVDGSTILSAPSGSALSVERISLGGPGEGAGDPDTILVTPERLMVTLAGTNELALIERVGVRESRIPVGKRPLAVAHDQAAGLAYVVNSLSDSVTVLDLSDNQITDTISLGPSPTPGIVERGEAAFFNAKLSLEGWMSCHSCHTDGHTNNGLADTLGDGEFGDAKRVPTLRGVWSTGPWAWNGSQHQLHSQILKSLSSTMHSSDVDDRLVTDLTAYVTKLERPPSVAVARGEGPHPTVEYRAREVFESAGCSVCHNGFTSYTTDDTFDVGLHDAHGQTQFNPPSLSGISQRDRFFHDGRAASLEEVLIRFEHPAKGSLGEDERQVIIDFLRAL